MYEQGEVKGQDSSVSHGQGAVCELIQGVLSEVREQAESNGGGGVCTVRGRVCCRRLVQVRVRWRPAGRDAYIP